jgi:mono/diheme cytochrome c family protein/glucose/arabinose dehydrogenase
MLPNLRTILALMLVLPPLGLADDLGAGMTKGLIDFQRPENAVQLVGANAYTLVPESDATCKWTFKDGVLTASPHWDSVVTADVYQDFRMHVEFNVNAVPDVDAEKNGNSGVYIQQRYELQILNSHGVSAADYKNSYCGSLYRQKKPDKLVSKPAGEWQSYDIVFRAARFEGEKRTENARITAYHNGELIHDDYALTRQTGAGKKEGPEARPIKLQGHHNPVRFRKVWIQRLQLDTPAPKPAEQPKKKGYTYVIPFDEIQPAPPLPPEEALKTFTIHEDFEISLVASDPQLENPLAIRFDGNGRMWVIEMRAYMPNEDGEGENEPIGRISIHEDGNGDGTFETSRVFLDNLVLPRSLAFYKNGILYGGHEKLYFVENVEGKAGEMTVIDEAYTQNGNVEHRSNGLLRGLDNWIYNVKSDMRYREVDGKWVKERTSFRGQWGISQDNHGRLHYNQNWFGLKADQLLPNTLMRNPNYLLGGNDASMLSYRDTVFPARITPGVNRGGEGAIDARGYLTAVTAACGPVRYRGDQFPEKYHDRAFFCEPSAHFVRMIQVHDEDGALSGKHALVEREFLASTDERFRPVNLFNAPDGSLFLVDLYHGILQHKGYLTRYLREHIAHRDLASSPRLGRIYRIAHRGQPLGKQAAMLGQSAVSLVPFLAHTNGWWRDTAQQLIIDSGDRSAISALNALAIDGTQPLGQIHALWTLEGLGAINRDAITEALASNDVYVLESAIRLSELLPDGEAKAMLPQLTALAARPELVVQRQLVASLGRIPSPAALKLLKDVLLTHIDTPMFREAAINGLAGREAEFQALLGEDFTDNKFRQYLSHCLTIKTTAGRFKPPRDKAHQASFKRGEAVYVSTCMACHGADGMGLPMLGPPLVKSEWVQGSHTRLAAILLQGLMGPITVNGKSYTPAAAMPGLKDAPEIGDTELADVATFVRHAWNNRKGMIKPEQIREVRKSLADRDTVFSPEELLKAYR